MEDYPFSKVVRDSDRVITITRAYREKLSIYRNLIYGKTNVTWSYEWYRNQLYTRLTSLLLGFP